MCFWSSSGFWLRRKPFMSFSSLWNGTLSIRVRNSLLNWSCKFGFFCNAMYFIRLWNFFLRLFDIFTKIWKKSKVVRPFLSFSGMKLDTLCQSWKHFVKFEYWPWLFIVFYNFPQCQSSNHTLYNVTMTKNRVCSFLFQCKIQCWPFCSKTELVNRKLDKYTCFRFWCNDSFLAASSQNIITHVNQVYFLFRCENNV